MCKEIQKEAVAKSYMRKGFLIYEERRKFFPIPDLTRSLLISLCMRKILFPFLSVCAVAVSGPCSIQYIYVNNFVNVKPDLIGSKCGTLSPIGHLGNRIIFHKWSRVWNSALVGSKYGTPALICYQLSHISFYSVFLMSYIYVKTALIGLKYDTCVHLLLLVTDSTTFHFHCTVFMSSSYIVC